MIYINRNWSNYTTESRKKKRPVLCSYRRKVKLDCPMYNKLYILGKNIFIKNLSYVKV